LLILSALSFQEWVASAVKAAYTEERDGQLTFRERRLQQSSRFLRVPKYLQTSRPG
jgi:hypothetical protein